MSEQQGQQQSGQNEGQQQQGGGDQSQQQQSQQQGQQGDQGQSQQQQQAQGDQQGKQGEGQQSQQKPNGQWGENWRKDYAGEDAKLLTQLERFQSPKAALDAYFSAQKRISEGGLKPSLPDSPTPEQLIAWRKENGIPEKSEDYLAKLPEGLVIGEADRPLFESFVKSLHDVNADPKVAHAAVAWYNKFQEDMQGAQRESDSKFSRETEDNLRAEWGADYRVNQAIRTTFLNRLPDGIKDVFLNSRMPDGRALGDHPDLSKWLVQMERELNPTATLSGGAMGGDGKSLEIRIAEIEKLQGNQYSEYWKGANSAKIQAEYDLLLKTRERLKARAA